MGRFMTNFIIGKEDVPMIRGIVAGNKIKDRRLSRAVGSDEAYNRLWGDFKGYSIHSSQTAKAFGDRVKGKEALETTSFFI